MSVSYNNNIPLNNYKERKMFWEKMKASIPEQTLLEHLNQLPAACAEILTLHYINNQSFPVLAQQLNKSLTTIRNRHDLGIFLLAKQLSS